MLQRPALTSIISIIFIAILSLTSYSQSRFPGWKIYTSMKDVRGIGVTGNTVWAGSTGGMFSFDKNNPGSQQTFRTLDGLLSNEVNAIIIDNAGNVWAGGEDGAISRYNPGQQVFSVANDIQVSSETKKNINGFYQYANAMFLATEFSVIKFNVNTFQFVDQPYIYLGTFPPKTPVYDVLVVNDTIWASTKEGIAYANINSYLPIASSWSNFDTSNSVMLTDKTNEAVMFDNSIYFANDSCLLNWRGGSLQLYTPIYNIGPVMEPVTHLAVSGGAMYFSTSNNNIYRVQQGNLTNADLILNNTVVNSLTAGSGGELFIGTSSKGVLIYNNGSTSSVLPNGPNSNIFAAIEVDASSNVFGSSGGSGEGVYRLSGTTWKNFTTETHPWMRGNDFRHLYASRFSSTVWAGGFGNGLLKMDGDSVFNFSSFNSCLSYFQSPGFDLVEGISEDPRGKLWVINRAPVTNQPILNFTDCAGYFTPGNQSQTTMINLAIDSYGTLWMTFPNDLGGSRGIVYYNPDVNSGAIINASQLGQDMSAVNDIIVDNNGEVWISTDNGISIVQNPYQVVANPNSVPSFYKMRIIENGLSTPLTENVQTLRADALNNKWLGTKSNGLIYVSPDGTTLQSRFNTTNSPLPDDEILSLSTDKNTGITYIGTGKGMVSYKTIAVNPLENCDKIKVGPNPFILPSSSQLRIDGLVAESTVKILSISGALIKEFVSPGGRIANWDGTDTYGNLVPSGIYIIAGFNKDGSKVCTGKVAVVRK